MLSRLNPIAGCRSLLKCVGQFQVPAASVATSVQQNQSGQKDSANVSRPERLENCPETRFGFIPKSWFDFMYPKTGVTGPYMLITGLGTYMFSKEIIVISPEFSLFLAGVTIVAYIHNAHGAKIRSFIDENQAKQIEGMNSQQLEKKKNINQQIEDNNELKWQAEGIFQHLPEAKRENVYLQMEAAYRARMQEAYAKVKNHLDYQVEKQNVERRIAQKNMVDYVIRNVEASISSQLKTNAMKQCIKDLKSLSARA